MKTIVMALALVAAQAQAQHWEAPNKSGGRIILTEIKCSISGLESLLTMWTEAPDGRTTQGCWTVFADKIQVIYSDGTRYSYDPAGFIRRGQQGTNRERPL